MTRSGSVGGGEAVTTADGRDFQVQRSVLGVAALFHEILRGFAFQTNLNKIGLLGMALAEMGTEAALALMNTLHDVFLCEYRVIVAFACRKASENASHLCIAAEIQYHRGGVADMQARAKVTQKMKKIWRISCTPVVRVLGGG